MLPSIIQLLEMHFIGIKVWPRDHIESNGQGTMFDFDGVEIREITNTQQLPVDKDGLAVYRVLLRIAIENAGGKIAPYDIDVGVFGIFEISKDIPDEERKNLVTVNGCSMLYGAIREHIMTLSARSIHGILILPTVNFQDKIKRIDSNLKENKSAKSNKPNKRTKNISQ